MRNFQQYTPTEIVFGKGTEQETGRLAKKWGANKVLLVFGQGSVKKSGLLNTIEKELDAAGLPFEEFGGAKPNPRLSFAREGVKRALAFGADFVLAVGGGSAIDTAKAIALGTANPEKDLWDLWLQKESIETSLPVGVVLTIAAAGSETSNSAVLTDEETKKKVGLSTDYNRPKFAVMNPELTFTVPAYQVSCGVVDIYMHTLDRYFSPYDGNQLTDEIAEGLMRTVIRNGAIVCQNKEDYDAMSEIMWCGSVSHNGITGLGRGRDFTVHKLGHELSAKFDAAHGATLSALWGSWARYTYHVNPERFARYGKIVWGIKKDSTEEAAMAAIEQTEDFFQSLKMPISMGELLTAVQPDEVLQDMAKRATSGGTARIGTFLPLAQQDVYEIYRMANH